MTRWHLLLLPFLFACSNAEHDTLTDHWPNGNVKRELIVSAGDTTEIAMYDTAGRLSKVSRWSEGQKHGKWEAFYPDGKPWSIHHYKKGIQVGAYFTWHPNGNPFVSGQYDSIGEPTGMWRFFNDQGNLIREERGPSIHN
ncbi:MAG: hypothetical protein CL828_09685 [Crocinitomicaceae bacterium]|nr:hypothetical protein [Crocinitomicaceae bacterium]